jgi:hypothetical protein
MDGIKVKIYRFCINFFIFSFEHCFLYFWFFYSAKFVSQIQHIVISFLKKGYFPYEGKFERNRAVKMQRGHIGKISRVKYFER